METVGLQERLREPEMVETGASNAELKITPELSGSWRVHDPGCLCHMVDR